MSGTLWCAVGHAEQETKSAAPPFAPRHRLTNAASDVQRAKGLRLVWELHLDTSRPSNARFSRGGEG